MCPEYFVYSFFFYLFRRSPHSCVTCLHLSSFRHVVLRSPFVHVELRDVSVIHRYCDRLLQKNGQGPTKPRRRGRTSYGKQMRKRYTKCTIKIVIQRDYIGFYTERQMEMILCRVKSLIDYVPPLPLPVCLMTWPFFLPSRT